MYNIGRQISKICDSLFTVHFFRAFVLFVFLELASQSVHSFNREFGWHSNNDDDSYKYSSVFRTGCSSFLDNFRFSSLDGSFARNKKVCKYFLTCLRLIIRLRKNR